MSDDEFAHEYFEWLYSQVWVSRNLNPARSYRELLSLFHSLPFQAKLEMDENRVKDGMALREDFFDEIGIDYPYMEWNQVECTFLEMLVGLVRRLDQSLGGEEWFLELLGNLELDWMKDNLWLTHSCAEEASEAVWRVNRRTYSEDGTGGLFPLRYPPGDQRRMEIWDQMQSYIMERFDFDE